MKYNILIFSFLVLIIGVMGVSAITLSDSINTNIIIPDNLNDVKKAGIGFADRDGIDIIERSEKFIITSMSKDPAVIYIPVQKPDKGKNWQDAYTITHYNETGYPLNDKTTVPYLINKSWYVVFKNTDWSYLEVGGVMQFWDATDIPTLYTAIGDNSKISLSSGIYTMHIPFYQNKSTDNFYFSETVHLKTVVGTAVAYYRWAGNTTFNNAAIHAWNTTSGTIVTDNSIARSYIYSDSVASGDITNCNMSYLGYDSWERYGIYLYSSNNNTFTNNTYNHNYHGIFLDSSTNNTLISNNALGNIEYGIFLDSSSNNNTLTSNNASGNMHSGILLYSFCDNNTITNNDVFENAEYGIYLYSSSNNTLTSNNIFGNIEYGIYLYSSNNNSFANNYFNNINNAYDTGYNTWNITPIMGINIISGPWLGGNYWSDYMGVDQTCDGLGDTPTPYNAGITNGGDYHPLVHVSLSTLTDEIKLITSEITSGLKSINMGNYLVYTFILIGILLIILGIQIITDNIYRG